VYRYLIEVKGCDVNAQNDDKNTPFYLAFRYFKGGNIAVLTYLLYQKDINVNIAGEYGRTILHWACKHINKLPLEIFKVLITLGADVNAQDNSNDTPLHYAIRCFNQNKGGDIAVLTYLLTQTNVNVNIKGEDGYTLLHIACININRLPLDIFKVLIETMGWDVNTQDNNNDTPLHCAIRCFDPDDSDGITVSTYLLNQTNINVNIKGSCDSTILHAACLNINKIPLDIFKVLIETHGADVNAQDANNDTPFHLAFLHFGLDNDGLITILTYLLSHKTVNVNIKDTNDRNLLHWACMDNLSGATHSMELNLETDTSLCQIVERMVEICIQQILDETMP
jgi:ankyrin repeat protein